MKAKTERGNLIDTIGPLKNSWLMRIAPIVVVIVAILLPLYLSLMWSERGSPFVLVVVMPILQSITFFFAAFELYIIFGR